MNCVVCGTVMDPMLAPEVSHPSCSATSFLYDTDGPDPFNEKLKQELLEAILHAERNQERTLQKEIGPSEIGDPCDRKIAYRLAQATEINTAHDPWPSTVGTAIHTWLASALERWNTDRGHRYLVETEIPFSFGGKGHGDAFNTDGVVIDWKSASKEVMREVRTKGPSPTYITQVQIYGYGYACMGKEVSRVALVYVPRSGWIKDMFVWSADYDEQVAVDALNRMFRIAATAVQLDVVNQPHRYEQVAASPSDNCGRCPWFNPMRTTEQGASELGCPGN